MKRKLNNKGFAISTILYGLLVLVILIIMLIFQIMRTNNNNSKDLGKTIQEEFAIKRIQKYCKSNCDSTDSTKLSDCLNKTTLSDASASCP